METAEKVDSDRIVMPARIDARPLWRRLAGPVAVGAGAIAACGYLSVVNPNEAGHYPSCPSRSLLGIDCPGCGGMRGMYSLLHGDVAGAMDHNVLLLAIVPIVVGLWVLWLSRAIRGRYPQVSYRQFRLRNRLLIVGLIALIGFGVVRNFVPYLGSGV
ncbi:MAG: DUF2752 domain-containing protein [Actinomycetota bacterium]|nr:DUF2752 domain-containing protein [Actinomycetota bacterium]MDP2288967.1 DUF2752 domain-containing protein [Actinomycetota bacterium]